MGKNADVISEAFAGNFPIVAGLYDATYATCVTRQDLCDGLDAEDDETEEAAVSDLDKCEGCKSVVADIAGVLTRSKGAPGYLSRKHVWAVLEEECTFIVARFPKRLGLRLQESCQDLLQDYDEDMVDVFSSADPNPGRTICGKQTARMCRKGKGNKWNEFRRSVFHAASGAPGAHYDL